MYLNAFSKNPKSWFWVLTPFITRAVAADEASATRIYLEKRI